MSTSNSLEMDFPIPEQIGTADKVTGRDKPRSGVFLRSGKGMVILGIGFIGVLAVTAVVAVQLSSPSTPPSESKPEDLSSPLISGHAKSASIRSPADFAKIQKLIEQKEKIAEEKRILEATQRKVKSKATLKSRDNLVCTSPQCVESAERLKRAIDTSVDPCVNFYDFACGKWYQDHPATNQSLGVFYTVDNNVQEALLKILQSDPLPGDPAPLIDIRTHYKTCIDTDTMDRVGMAPLWNQLKVQGGWPMAMEDWDEKQFVMEEALVHIRKIGVSPLISVSISYDIKNTSHKIFFVNEGQLGLPSDVLLKPILYGKVIEEYKKYIAESARLVRDSLGSSVGDDAIDADVNDLVNFEISLAQAMDFRPKKMTDLFAKTNIAGLQEITDTNNAGQFDWLKYFQVMFQETDVVINEDEPLYLMEGRYMVDLSPLIFNTPSRTIANYLGWWWTSSMSSETTYAMRNLTFAFDQSVYGLKSAPDRSNYCLAQTNSKLGFPLSRAYIDSYFSPHTKEESTELVALIRKAFMSLLNENTWMAPEDLVVAKEKLSAVVDHEAYPDWIMDNALLTLAFDGLEIKPKEQFDNLIRMADYKNFWDLETFRNHYTKTFIMPPTTVNAFYVPNQNDITILAAILQAPFFSLNSLAALNYGGIGMVIGHEFTHGFDNTGRRFDKDGNLVSWWSRDTINAFNERTKCFKEQYNAYYPPELQGTQYNMSVNGQQTLGENIADNGGIREAFRGYMAFVEEYGEEARLPGLEEYSPSQLFFLGFANVWCEHKTTDDLVYQLESDPHAPGRFRVIGSLSNDQDFRETFNCPLTSPMNRGNDRCQLW